MKTNESLPSQEHDILKDLDIYFGTENETTWDNQTINTSILETQEWENLNQTIQEQEKTTIPWSKWTLFKSYFVFTYKYITLSSLIFWVLMITTNYSAYFNIAKSYIYAEDIKEESEWILSSVEASNIKKQVTQTIKINTLAKSQEQEKEQKNEYSIRKLVTLSNKKDIDLDIEITPYENRIIIPKIGKNIPLVDIKNRKIEGQKELNDIFMTELENWVIRYPGSSKPWEEGNVFIFWHSSNFPWINWEYNDVFALLDKVVYDDDIIVYYWQKKYIYRIKEKRVIRPGDVWVLTRNKNKKELTLMTCWPIGTTLKRLVVTWELIEA